MSIRRRGRGELSLSSFAHLVCSRRRLSRFRRLRKEGRRALKRDGVVEWKVQHEEWAFAHRLILGARAGWI